MDAAIAPHVKGFIRSMRFGSLSHFPALLCAAISVLTLCPAVSAAGINPRFSDQGPLPDHSALVGRLNSTEAVNFSLSLPLRNEAELDALLTRIYDPLDPFYHHYLTTDQFASRYSPTEADYAKMIADAQSKGLAVTQTSSNRLLLGVSATSAQVESLFSVHMMHYNRLGRDFHVPDSSARLPDSLSQLGANVIGLNTGNLPLSHAAVLASVIGPRLVNGLQWSGFDPADIKLAYNLKQTRYDGTGQTTALVELDTYHQSDITQYASSYGLATPNLTIVSVDGGVSSPGQGALEAELDIEVSLAITPKANIEVYEAPDNSLLSAVDIYNRIASDNTAKTISTSWGLDEGDVGQTIINSENSIFKQMATQGQTMFAAAGDNGAYDDGTSLSVDDPGSQPYVVDVGGTTLTLASNGNYGSETSWDDPTPLAGAPFGSGGGGGISQFWAIPSFQTGIAHNGSAGQFSTTSRNVPDVSLDADPATGYSIFYTDRHNGSWTQVGGTSAAAPLWAGLTALVNEQLAASNLTTIGFANPLIYSLYKNSTTYARDFHDIADGSNNLFYKAVTGYDTATGLGTPVGSNLIADLSNAAGSPPSFPSSITLSPNSAATGSGPVALTVTGANFRPGAVVMWNGTQLNTSYVSSTQVTTNVSSTLLKTAGSSVVAVSNADGTLSPSTVFTIGAAGSSGPTVSLLNPAAASLGGPAFGLTVNGSGFVSGATVLWNGSALTTTFVSSSDLSAEVPSGLLDLSGSATIVVENPDSSESGAITFTINGQTTSILSISPSSALTGGSAFTLSVTGTGFTPNTIVEWSGTALATTYLSATSLSASVSSSRLVNAATVQVTAVDPTDGTSNQVPFSILLNYPAPTISSVSPPSLTVGSGQTNIAIFGSGFESSTVVELNGSTLQSTLISSGEIDAVVPASFTATSATDTLRLVTPSPGGGSIQISYAVTSALPTITSTSPSTVSANGGAFTLTVTGTNFEQGSVIDFGNTTLATTFVSSTEVQALVPASVFVEVASIWVTVANPAPGGGVSNTVTFTVQPAVLFTFPAGLQMVSAPTDFSFVPLNKALSASTVLLAAWDPLNSVYDLTPTAPANALDPGVGYWVRFTAATSLYAVGAAIPSGADYNIPLEAGWNIVGTPYTQSEPISSLNVIDSHGNTSSFGAATSQGLLSPTLFSYGPTSTAYVTHTSGDTIDPFVGYWVFASQSVLLQIPAP